MPVAHRVAVPLSSSRSRAYCRTRLQQPVARVSILLLRHHQALVDQRRQQIEDFRCRHALAGADLLPPPPASSRRQTPTAAATAALRLVQQVVAPVDERAQRLLARQRRPRAAGQQAEAVVQLAAISSTDSARTRAAANSMASGMPSRRRQSEATAGAFWSVTAEIRSAPAARDRRRAAPTRTADSVCGVSACVAVRQRQRRHPVRLLAGDAERLAAASPGSSRRALPQERVGQLSRRRRSGARSCRGAAGAACRLRCSAQRLR